MIGLNLSSAGVLFADWSMGNLGGVRAEGSQLGDLKVPADLSGWWCFHTRRRIMPRYATAAVALHRALLLCVGAVACLGVRVAAASAAPSPVAAVPESYYFEGVQLPGQAVRFGGHAQGGRSWQIFSSLFSSRSSRLSLLPLLSHPSPPSLWIMHGTSRIPFNTRVQNAFRFTSGKTAGPCWADPTRTWRCRRAPPDNAANTRSSPRQGMAASRRHVVDTHCEPSFVTWHPMKW